MNKLTAKETAENWAACRTYLRYYAIAAWLLACAIMYGIGYLTGAIHGAAEIISECIDEESNHVSE